jgi:prolyl-tRNA editing enzyme YbaK/EbsC (Cys-tRNA(Pro) deacylase)
MTQALPKRVRQFAEAAAALGVKVDVREFPDGTRTAADAARAIGVEVDQIVKSLVFMVDGKPLLALTAGGNRVDEERLRAVRGAGEVRKADAAEAREATGYAIGGTPPFGHPAQLPVLLDPRLTTFDTVWAAAGTHTHVFPITPAELLRTTGAEVVDVTAG